MCTVAINVFEPGAFNAKSQYFIPLFNRISWLCGQHPRGDEASSGGANSGPTGHDFPDNSNVYLTFSTMRTGPFSKCENRSGSQIGCQVRTWAVLTRRISTPVRTLNPVLLTIDIFGCHCPVLTENRVENQSRFSANGWEPPNTGLDFKNLLPENWKRKEKQNCQGVLHVVVVVFFFFFS
jgi:hypothetical protein